MVWRATRSEAGLHADRLFEVERSVRAELHRKPASTAREITRRLLSRQGALAEIQNFLQGALNVALRVCPSASDGRVPTGAVEGENNIWNKIVGLQPDLRLLRGLGQAAYSLGSL